MSDLTDEELIATRKLHGLDDDLFRENIEIGEYVRTADGKIAKLIEPMVYELDDGEVIDFLENIVKHSKQLIDLIKIGDIIKLRISMRIGTVVYFMEKIDDIQTEESIQNLKKERNATDFEILEILTKEQYEANCYKVGGKDER